MKFRAKRRSNFNPHSPCGERPIGGFEHFVPAEISIHTPLAGSDYSCSSDAFSGMIFQSTLPLRGATPSNAVKSASSDFNPHSPCGERLAFKQSLLLFRSYFNPHSPCGERHDYASLQRIIRHFNPHSPCGERQDDDGFHKERDEFQSTLPLRGATWQPSRGRNRCRNFNPHSPCGERLAVSNISSQQKKFQSTLPLRGATAEMRHF